MDQCPICNAEISKSEIICSACREKVRLNEPVRREERIRNVADTLVVFIAVFLFLKGVYALLAVENYKEMVSSMGFPVTSAALHYWNASICIAAALGYAVTALGNYLAAPWSGRVCRAVLVFFVVGQLVIQLGDISDEFITAEAISVVFLLSAVPVLQYVMSVMSRRGEKDPTRGPGEEGPLPT